jgi:hypothetical protein
MDHAKRLREMRVLLQPKSKRKTDKKPNDYGKQD